MTLNSSLTRSLTRVSRRLIRQVGVPCLARRRVALDDQPDNSASWSWETISGQEAPFPIVLQSLTDRQRRELFGETSRATCRGTAELARGLVTGDLLFPRAGSFLGRAFEVRTVQPEDVGGTLSLELVEVPPRSEHGVI